MADVGLQRTQPQRPLAVLAVGGQQRLRLDRVAQRRAGAVRLHRVHVGGLQPGIGQRLPDHALLRRAVGGGQAVGRAVLVDGAAADHREHRVPVAAGVRQPLQQDHADALTETGTVGALGEGLAPAVGGDAALLAEAYEQAGARHHGRAAGQGQLALSRAQGLRSQVDRHQGRGAGGVDGDGRTLQAEDVRDPAGAHAGLGAHAEERLDAVRDVVQGAAVVGAHQADEDARSAAAQGARVDARPLESLPAGLQEQPLLRVHRERLARRDAEEARVEGAGVGEEAALTGAGRQRVGSALAEESAGVPAAVLGERGDGVPRLADQGPQVIGRGDPAGVAAAHGHHGDRLVGPLGQTLVGLPESFVVHQCAAQGSDHLLLRGSHHELHTRRSGQDSSSPRALAQRTRPSTSMLWR